MKRAEEMNLIRDRLIRRRDEIFKTHVRAEDARRDLMEPEVEFEETAQNESIADALGQLDERERQEIEAIDGALEKIKLGKYGFCDVCLKPITAKRLRALPWTSLCALHAKEQSGHRPKTERAKGSIPPEHEGLPGSELRDMIADELLGDGDVEMDELKISVRGGRLHLEGFLPTEAQRRRLLEIVQDHLEFSNIVDEVVVSRAPWDREDRASGTEEIEDLIEELEAEETEDGQVPVATGKRDTLLSPTDVAVPKKR